MLSKLNAGEPMEGTWMKSLKEKSIASEVCTVIEAVDWMKPIKDFILKELPDDDQHARKICITTSRFVLVNNQLTSRCVISP